MYEIDAAQAQNELCKLIQMVNEKSIPIEIRGKTEADSVVIMSAKCYKAMQEQLNQYNYRK